VSLAPPDTGTPVPAPVSDPHPIRPLPDHVRVAIVGSGFSGLAAAIRLMQSGETDFAVLERGNDVGGTWRDNSYPGCACDVPSHLYSFSFAPNPEWTRSFSGQPEIQAYIQRTARETGVLPHIHFRTELLEAAWNNPERRWHIRTNRGEFTAEILVVGAGPLSEPTLPDIPGIERFTGTTFHSATWNHDHDMTGERVAVIGTGASSIQFVPYVQKHAAHLRLFQRTAPWVLPRQDRPIRTLERALYRNVPLARRALRSGIYALRESWLVGFTMKPQIMALAEKQAHRMMRNQVPDAELRRKLTPTYRLGCKRVLISNDYYPAVAQPNVDVETEKIVEVTENEIVTADGSRHEVDTIIFGTGFHVTDHPIASRIRGRDGRTLAEHWGATGMNALHGLTVAGFPNLFYLVGPNTGTGNTSIIFMAEAQVEYLLSALSQMDAQELATIEPRPEVQYEYRERIQEQLQGTVWNTGGCASWYLDANGRNTTLWPTFTFRFRSELSKCDLAEYRAERRDAAVRADVVGVA
jgi:cation diffusion facilitator CzcD-associated flavoprotein CzcO